jgi:hypothetical protein
MYTPIHSRIRFNITHILETLRALVATVARRLHRLGLRLRHRQRAAYRIAVQQ